MTHKSRSFAFLHIPKCAGTSVISWLYNSATFGYRIIKYYPVYKTQRNPVRVPSNSKIIIAGHFLRHMGTNTEVVLPHDIPYVTLLRDPVDVLISFYNWSKKSRHSWTSFVNLEQFLVDFVLSSTKQKYLQSPLLDALPLRSDQETIHDYCSRFSIIETTDNLHIFKAKIEAIIGFQLPEIPHMNKSSSSLISTDIRSQLQNVLHDDYELFNHVLSRGS